MNITFISPAESVSFTVFQFHLSEERSLYFRHLPMENKYFLVKGTFKDEN